jgi:hypothetical protein
LKKDQNEKSPGLKDRKPLVSASKEMARELFALSGSEALNQIFKQDRPHQLVQHMDRVDFFWLVKKIGEDALPLLRMASLEQWQHLLDMELWERDRVGLDQTTAWVGKLQKADPERLVRWLFSDGQLLAYYYFWNKIQVEIKEGDEVYELPEGFFTHDNLYYIRILDKENEEVIGSILRQMAQEDYDRYQALLLGLAGVLPDEVEEEMYRLRNVRLAEDGFLPVDEALSVYSYLKADSLKVEESSYKVQSPSEKEGRTLVPVLPLIHAPGNNLLAQTAERVTDTLFLDRVRLEFAGLCNQVSSADGLKVEGLEDLILVCRKAAGYINIGLEQLSDRNINSSVQLLKDNPLIAIFRVGFGLALELKWEAERWIKEAWFARQDLGLVFWGDEWGGILAGVLQKRPRLFKGLQEGDEYKEFEQLSEVEDGQTVLRRLVLLDRLLEILTTKCPLDKDSIKDPLLTFHPLLFNFWAHGQLGLDSGFATLSLEQVRDLFRLLRAKSPKPPYRMPGFKDTFIADLMTHAPDFEPDAAHLLKETLSMLWQTFLEEYAWVATADLDDRFAKFILIQPFS